jgi:hypothetical protein
MSGVSNVELWLSSRNIRCDDALVQAIFQRAKASDRLLVDEEIWATVTSPRGGG